MKNHFILIKKLIQCLFIDTLIIEDNVHLIMANIRKIYSQRTVEGQ